MNNDMAKRQLTDKRQELLMTIEGIRAGVMTPKGPVAEDDQAQVEHEDFISFQRNNLSYDTLRLVDEALDRLDTGEYGICQACEESISEKRLKAVPWAKHCVPCQERLALLEADTRPVTVAEGLPAYM